MKAGWYFRRRLGTKPLGWRRSGLLETTWSILLLDLLLSISFGGGGGRDNESDVRTWSFGMGGGGVSEGGSGVEPDSANLGRSEVPTRDVSGGFDIVSFDLLCALERFSARPRLLGGSPSRGEWRPSSSVSLMVGASLSRRLLAALSLRKLLASASLSRRLRSLRLALRSSFSSSSAHQPARESQRCASTFSMTISMSTPAARILCSTSFSSSVVNGGGCCSFNISCCLGACSASHGCCKISASVGRSRGRFERSC